MPAKYGRQWNRTVMVEFTSVMVMSGASHMTMVFLMLSLCNCIIVHVPS
jgi:hypothetical protein